MKSLDNYFNDLEKSAKNIGFGFDELKNTMAEIYKKDSFMSRTFFNTTPSWYYRKTKGVLLSNTIFLFSNEPKFKKEGFTKKIRNNITLKYKSTNTKEIKLFYVFWLNDSGQLFSKQSYGKYQKRLQRKLNLSMLTQDKKNSITEELKQYEEKVKLLVDKYLFTKIVELFENIPSHNISLSEIKEIVDNKGSFYIKIKLNSTKFKIISYSKSDLYSKESDFISILEEYKNKGILKKTTETVFTSIRNEGKFNSSIIYFHNNHYGEWIPAIINSEKYLRDTAYSITEEFDNFTKVVEGYLDLALEDIIKKYKKEPINNKRFKNEF